MKRISTPSSNYADPSRPPNDDESDASLSDGSNKRVKTAQSFESLFNSENLSDVVLDVNEGQHVFLAHKMIVGLKSERLAALISSTTSPQNSTQHVNSDCVINNNASYLTDNFRTSGKSCMSNSMSNSASRSMAGINNNLKNSGIFEPDCVPCGTGIKISGNNPGTRPVVYLQETPACGAVFSRFLYFIYSGAVWLHRDYVLSLFQLAVKYGVAALAAHCENYALQLLRKCVEQTPGANGASGLSVATICDMFEEDGYREETRDAAFTALANKFGDLIKTDRWASCRWRTVRDLLRSDETFSPENVILVSATDWMKRNKLQDRSQILDILAAIRYPRLPRRVLYHLYKNGSFKNFPQVQEKIESSIRYHCFKEVPEAHGDFTGSMYHHRGPSGMRTSESCQQKTSFHAQMEAELDDLNHYESLAETIRHCHNEDADQTMRDREVTPPPAPPSVVRPFLPQHATSLFSHRPALAGRHASIPDGTHASRVAAVSPRVHASHSPSRDTDVINSQRSHTQV